MKNIIIMALNELKMVNILLFGRLCNIRFICCSHYNSPLCYISDSQSQIVPPLSYTPLYKNCKVVLHYGEHLFSYYTCVYHYRVLLSMVNVSVTMPDVALLVTEYWYTPGSLPVTVSVLR